MTSGVSGLAGHVAAESQSSGLDTATRRRGIFSGRVLPTAAPDKVHFWQYLRLYFALFCREFSWRPGGV
jgi:hypothetical protein